MRVRGSILFAAVKGGCELWEGRYEISVQGSVIDVNGERILSDWTEHVFQASIQNIWSSVSQAEGNS